MRFSDIIGQEAVRQRLIRSVEDGRLAHALMFLGPEGSGNLAFALALAQYLQCAHRTGTDACGQCASCRKVATLQHADVHFSFPYFNKPAPKETISDDYVSEWRSAILEDPYLDVDHWLSVLSKEKENKQLNFSVHEAGNIIRKLSLKAYEGGPKIMIVWMAEMLKPETANKLLKIVEEPPENTLFFFVANSAESILPTILSRVQVIQVPKISDEDMEDGLLRLGMDQEKAAQVAHFADGNWWKAKVLASADDPNEFFTAQFQLWMRSCYKRDVSALVRWSGTMGELSREEQKQFLTYALDQVRQNLVLNFVGEDLARLNSGERQFSEKFARFINDLNAESLMEELNAAHRDISRNGNPKLVFTDLSLRVHRLLHRTAQ